MFPDSCVIALLTGREMTFETSDLFFMQNVSSNELLLHCLKDKVYIVNVLEKVDCARRKNRRISIFVLGQV